eukprot:Clim_evm36s142 gene=Clim_evmTU36s142
MRGLFDLKDGGLFSRKPTSRTTSAKSSRRPTPTKSEIDNARGRSRTLSTAAAAPVFKIETEQITDQVIARQELRGTKEANKSLRAARQLSASSMELPVSETKVGGNPLEDIAQEATPRTESVALYSATSTTATTHTAAELKELPGGVLSETTTHSAVDSMLSMQGSHLDLGLDTAVDSIHGSTETITESCGDDGTEIVEVPSTVIEGLHSTDQAAEHLEDEELELVEASDTVENEKVEVKVTDTVEDEEVENEGGQTLKDDKADFEADDMPKDDEAELENVDAVEDDGAELDAADTAKGEEVEAETADLTGGNEEELEVTDSPKAEHAEIETENTLNDGEEEHDEDAMTVTPAIDTKSATVETEEVEVEESNAEEVEVEESNAEEVEGMESNAEEVEVEESNAEEVEGMESNAEEVDVEEPNVEEVEVEEFDDEAERADEAEEAGESEKSAEEMTNVEKMENVIQRVSSTLSAAKGTGDLAKELQALWMANLTELVKVSDERVALESQLESAKDENEEFKLASKENRRRLAKVSEELKVETHLRQTAEHKIEVMQGQMKDVANEVRKLYEEHIEILEAEVCHRRLGGEANLGMMRSEVDIAKYKSIEETLDELATDEVDALLDMITDDELEGTEATEAFSANDTLADVVDYADDVDDFVEPEPEEVVETDGEIVEPEAQSYEDDDTVEMPDTEVSDTPVTPVEEAATTVQEVEVLETTTEAAVIGSDEDEKEHETDYDEDEEEEERTKEEEEPTREQDVQESNEKPKPVESKKEEPVSRPQTPQGCAPPAAPRVSPLKQGDPVAEKLARMRAEREARMKKLQMMNIF